MQEGCRPAPFLQGKFLPRNKSPHPPAGGHMTAWQHCNNAQFDRMKQKYPHAGDKTGDYDGKSKIKPPLQGTNRFPRQPRLLHQPQPRIPTPIRSPPQPPHPGPAGHTHGLQRSCGGMESPQQGRKGDMAGKGPSPGPPGLQSLYERWPDKEG